MILSPMYFEKDQLKQWLSAQQIAQFEGMYSDIVQTAYENALGLLYSEVGHILDLDTMLSETNPDKKDPTLKWVLLRLQHRIPFAQCLRASAIQLRKSARKGERAQKRHEFDIRGSDQERAERTPANGFRSKQVHRINPTRR